MGPHYGKGIPKVEPGSGTPIKALQDFLWDNGTAEEFTEVFNVNVTAAWFTTISFLGLLEAGNKPGNALEDITSQVITISSLAAFRRFAITFQSHILQGTDAPLPLNSRLGTQLQSVPHTVFLRPQRHKWERCYLTSLFRCVLGSVSREPAYMFCRCCGSTISGATSSRQGYFLLVILLSQKVKCRSLTTSHKKCQVPLVTTPLLVQISFPLVG